MRVNVRFFASLADIVKSRTAEVELEDPIATVGDVFAYFSSKYPDLAKYSENIMLAVNGEFATADTKIKSGDEVAFLPPVSGGVWS